MVVKEEWEFNVFGDFEQVDRRIFFVPKDSFVNRIHPILSSGTALKVNSKVASYDNCTINATNKTYTLGETIYTNTSTEIINVYSGYWSDSNQLIGDLYAGSTSGNYYSSYITEVSVVNATGTLYIHK